MTNAAKSLVYLAIGSALVGAGVMIGHALAENNHDAISDDNSVVTRQEVLHAIKGMPSHNFGVSTLNRRGDSWVITNREGTALILNIDREGRIYRLLIDPGAPSRDFDFETVIPIVTWLVSDRPESESTLSRFHDDGAAAALAVDVEGKLRAAAEGASEGVSRINTSSGALVTVDAVSKRITVER